MKTQTPQIRTPKTKALKNTWIKLLALLLLVLTTSSCASRITDVKQYQDGTYVVTGVKEGFGGTRGFVWIGTYDAQAKKFTVSEYRD